MFMNLNAVPWCLAVVTAVWFAWMAKRAGRNWLLWVCGGAVLGLVASTFIIGINHAAAIPFSAPEKAHLHLKWGLECVLAIGVFGWLVSLPLHRHAGALWTRLRAGNPPPHPPVQQHG
jgi:hypothetical protein